MSKELKITIGFASVKFNDTSKKWDVKLLINGKVKWVRGFNSDVDAEICAKSYLMIK